MAVVAVLLSNKLYVANVGEPPVPGQGGWGRGSAPGLCLLWAVRFPGTRDLQPESAEALGWVSCSSAGVAQSQAGTWAAQLSSPCCPQLAYGLWGVVSRLSHLSGFLFWKRLSTVEDSLGIPWRAVRWVGCGPEGEGHRDFMWDLWAKRKPSGNLRRPYP